MQPLAEGTGGYVVMSKSFGATSSSSPSRPSSRDAAGQGLRMAFGGALRVLTSSEFKVCSAIGNCNPLGKKSNNVAETEIGQLGS